MEEIPSLLNTAYKQIAAITRSVSESTTTGIYPLNPDEFSEEDLVSGEVPTKATVTIRL
jgi:hypothetical protein